MTLTHSFPGREGHSAGVPVPPLVKNSGQRRRSLVKPSVRKRAPPSSKGWPLPLTLGLPPNWHAVHAKGGGGKREIASRPLPASYPDDRISDQ